MIRNVRKVKDHKKMKNVIEECDYCKIIYNTVSAKGWTLRDELREIMNVAPTTIYDHINIMLRNGLMQNMNVSSLEIGRPISLFRDVKLYYDNRLVLTDLQKEALENIHEYDLYVHLWGRFTGKTTTATLMCLFSSEPIFYISSNRKTSNKAMFYHYSDFVKEKLNKTKYSVFDDEIFNGHESINNMCMFSTQQKYLKDFIDFRNKVGKDRIITVIIDEMYPNGDKIVDNLMMFSDIRIIIFTSLKYIEINPIRSIEIIKYTESLSRGFYNFNKSVFMDATYCPSDIYVKKYVKRESRNTLKMEHIENIRRLISKKKFIAEFECDLDYEYEL